MNRRIHHPIWLIWPLLLGLLAHPLAAAERDLTDKVLLHLGGLDISGGFGRATVSSSIEDAGQKEEVAHGLARQGRLGLTFFSVPKSKGWYLKASPGLLSQRVRLSDFDQTIPQSDGGSGTDIAANCSDPQTGKSLECGVPNTYALTLQSLSLGVGGGYQFLRKRRTRFQQFAQVGAHINALEYRQLHAVLGDYHSVSQGLAMAASGGVGWTAGVYFPRRHLAFRFSSSVEFYRSFTFDDPLYFKGPITYNADKDIYEQPIIEVDSTGLNTLTHRLSVVYIF